MEPAAAPLFTANELQVIGVLAEHALREIVESRTDTVQDDLAIVLLQSIVDKTS